MVELPEDASVMDLNNVAGLGRLDMDRVALIALLAVPILVVIHVALLSGQFAQGDRMTALAFPDAAGGSPVLQGHWQSPEVIVPTRLVIKHIPEQGS